jgi:serine/threonine protein phosphatase 1
MMSEPLPCPPASRPGPLGARPVLPPGHRAYAIGDVHGCLDQLRALHALIAADLAARPVARPVLIHMGDLIDRGTDSAGVVALLAAGSPIRGVPTLNLSGNHEQMLLEVLSIGTRQVAEHWLANGGDATLRSWGVPHRAPAKDWPALLPSEHLAFVRALLPLHRIGSWLFVHAGVRPGVPLDLQAHEDLLWIREPFLSHTGPLLPEAPEIAVLHGHTPVGRPDQRGWRLGIDTGAFKGGALTCAVLEGPTVAFLQS